MQAAQYWDDAAQLAAKQLRFERLCTRGSVNAEEYVWEFPTDFSGLGTVHLQYKERKDQKQFADRAVPCVFLQREDSKYKMLGLDGRVNRTNDVMFYSQRDADKWLAARGSSVPQLQLTDHTDGDLYVPIDDTDSTLTPAFLDKDDNSVIYWRSC